MKHVVQLLVEQLEEGMNMCLPYGGNKITQNCTRNTDARWRFNDLRTSWWQISNIFMLHIIMNLELFQ